MDGKLLQGYKERETDAELVLREAGTATIHKIAKDDIDARKRGRHADARRPRPRR